MTDYTQGELETFAADRSTDDETDECEDCAELSGAFPCADCYISGDVELPEGGA